MFISGPGLRLIRLFVNINDKIAFVENFGYWFCSMNKANTIYLSLNL